MAAIRYLINDVDRAIRFYTQHLGFKLDQQMGQAFAYVSKEDLYPLAQWTPRIRLPDRCPMDADQNQADGIGWSLKWMTCFL